MLEEEEEEEEKKTRSSGLEARNRQFCSGSAGFRAHFIITRRRRGSSATRFNSHPYFLHGSDRLRTLVKAV